MEMDGFQHQDFVWTWKGNRAGSRVSLWLPYFEGVEKVQGTRYRFRYNGGEFEADLKQVDFIMLYGAAGVLPVGFLDDLNTQRISLFVHRRNLPNPYVFHPAPATDDADVLTRQIVFRLNRTRSACIARALIAERFRAMRWLIAVPDTTLRDLRQRRSQDTIRNLEAQVTKRYWEAYFDHLGVEVARRASGPWKSALDAGSMFLYGVMLRWILFHKLSPAHGFLHQPTSYPSLAYDLMEPYRHLIEQATASAYAKARDETKLTAATLARLKGMLDEAVYVPATRQTVRRKTLLHGAVLALRAYLLGEVPRLVLPVEGARAGGRPPRTGYVLPGALAG